MRRATNAVAVAGASLLLMLAAGCADQDNQGNEDSGSGDQARPEVEEPLHGTPRNPNEEPANQPARTPPTDGEQVANKQLDTSALPERYPTMVWTEEDGSTLGVVAQEGGCGEASVEVPNQTNDEVVVVLVETTPADAQMCTMDLRYPKFVVELDSPLDERTVVLRSEQRTG